MNRLRYQLSWLHGRGGYVAKPLALLLSVCIVGGVYYIIGIVLFDQFPILLQSWEWIASVLMLPVIMIDTYVDNYIVSLVLAGIALYWMVYVLFRFSPNMEATLKLIALVILGLVVYRLYGV